MARYTYIYQKQIQSFYTGKMKTLILIFLIALSGQVLATTPNEWVLEAIKEMPTKGGYELTATPVKKMATAFTWSTTGEVLNLNPKLAMPSYCTTATYMIFYKVMQKYWANSGLTTGKDVLALIKPQLENDGVRIWGRWNSNGPGTGKFFFDAKLGPNFDNIDEALPGDFLKIWWNNEVGKLERGHSVIYLGREVVNGVEMIKFWSSNSSTTGFGEKLVPRTDAIRTLFSRLENPENISNLATLPETDEFLVSMLERVSSWNEVRTATGVTSN